ncbi:MAG: hypothetical protein QNJ33_18360 [Crocosphaera sp.]|nr:hypothetical protein [Crocosphaera sp.]
MARERFSDLERIYTTLKQAGVNMSQLPANLDIRKYGEWKEGDAPERTIVRPDLGDPVSVGIIAFGLPDTNAAAKIQLSWNTRAKTYFDGLGDKALFGIEATTLTDYNENGSFVPAQISLTVRGSSVTATSGITGRKYKKNQGNSYTIPIGQTGTVKHFQEAVQGLLDASIANTHFISASPEEWRRD